LTLDKFVRIYGFKDRLEYLFGNAAVTCGHFNPPVKVCTNGMGLEKTKKNMVQITCLLCLVKEIHRSIMEAREGTGLTAVTFSGSVTSRSRLKKSAWQ